MRRIPSIGRTIGRPTLFLLSVALFASATAAPLVPSLEQPPRVDVPQATGSVTGSSRTERQDAALFAGVYDPRTWSGWIAAYRIAPGGKAAEPEGLWGQSRASGDSPQPHTTATRMDAEGPGWPDRRLVLSARTPAAGLPAVGIPWRYDALSPAAQRALAATGRDDTGSAAEALARARLDFLRGDRGNEQAADRDGAFRSRGSRHGDVVHSRIWHQPGAPARAYAIESHGAFRTARSTRPAMLYVGANDGMLHGFDAATGDERIAYVPEGVQPRLAALADPAYRHAYYVDGSPLAGDLYLGLPHSGDPARWRTYLAGFPGAGGRGFFVLDITDPSAFADASAERLVVLDRTAEAGMDADVGHVVAEPVMEQDDPTISRQIARLNDGRWALVLGNGYLSSSGRAALLMQYLDGARELRKIIAGHAADPVDGLGGNGLAAPRLIDLDGNGSTDVAYAGDLQGNLWKFDLADSDPSKWQLAFAGAPLFVARDGSAAQRRQPITTAPVWKAHPAGGLVVAFGTGRLLTTADVNDRQAQTLYGIHDDTPIVRRRSSTPPPPGSGPAARGRTDLVAQTVRVDSGTVSSNPVPDGDGSAARRGWYLDLPVAGERVVRHPEWFEGDLIDFWTAVAPAPANGAGRNFRYTLDIRSGAAPRSQLYGHLPFAADGQASRVEATPGAAIRSGSQQLRLSLPGEADAAPPAALLGTVVQRPSWRQFQ